METKLTLRLYPGQDDDLIAWLADLESPHHGAKTNAIKAALRQGRGAAPTPTPASLPPDGAGVLTATDLAAIRAVLDAWGGAPPRSGSGEAEAEMVELSLDDLVGDGMLLE